jgi:hypothetical protein
MGAAAATRVERVIPLFTLSPLGIYQPLDAAAMAYGWV